MSKPFYQSKTFWFNLAVLVGTFLVDPNNDLETFGITSAWVQRTVAAGNIILRFASTAQLVFQRTA
jgi:hypothetical protein